MAAAATTTTTTVASPFETPEFLEAFEDPTGHGSPATRLAGPIVPSQGLRFVGALRQGPYFSSRASDHVRAMSVARDAAGLYWCFPMNKSMADLVDSLSLGKFGRGEPVRGVWRWDPLSHRVLLVEVFEQQRLRESLGSRGRVSRGRACRGPTIDDVISTLGSSDPRVFMHRLLHENPEWMLQVVRADLGPSLPELERLAAAASSSSSSSSSRASAAAVRRTSD